jgi:catechol 2,3-dioxygenase-like lactoylglutathione lyase family enzyme
MEPRISFVTLGVGDLERARAFYRDVLALPVVFSGGDVTFFEMGRTWLALYPRHLLAEDAGVENSRPGFAGITLAHNVGSPEEVDTLLAHAANGGGRLVRAGHRAAWGGYTGYFADPDGFLWEVAWNPKFPHV